MHNKELNHRIQNPKCLQLLSVASRAGKLRFGEDKCLQSVREHDALLVMMDGAVSQNTEKRFVNACTHHSIPLWRFDREAVDLASAVGRESNKTISLTDPGFYAKLLELEGLETAAMSKENVIAKRDSADRDMQGVEV